MADYRSAATEERRNLLADTFAQVAAASTRAGKDRQLSEAARHNVAEEGTQKATSDSLSKYHNELIRDLAERRRVDKLKLLLGGGSGGAAGADGKPLGSEAQKTSNLIDSARSSLNATEALAKANPKTAAAEQVVPDFLINLLGGKMKEVKDARAATKESFQNVYTGASASGEQIPSFKGFSGPGAGDILGDKVEGTMDNTRDNLNTLQQGYQRQLKPIDPNMLKAAGMQNDPIANAASQSREAAIQATQAKRIQGMTPEDRQLHQEIQTNPQHPKAEPARKYLQRRYGSAL